MRSNSLHAPHALTGFATPSSVGHKLDEDTEEGSNDDELELEDEDLDEEELDEEELDEEERELDELQDGEVDEDELDDDKLDEDESGMTFTLQIGSGTKG